jgi:hypothetical protein
LGRWSRGCRQCLGFQWWCHRRCRSVQRRGRLRRLKMCFLVKEYANEQRDHNDWSDNSATSRPKPRRSGDERSTHSEQESGRQKENCEPHCYDSRGSEGRDNQGKKDRTRKAETGVGHERPEATEWRVTSRLRVGRIHGTMLAPFRAKEDIHNAKVIIAGAAKSLTESR